MKLEAHPFIESISPERLESILTEIETLELVPDAVIFEEQSDPDALFLILEGRVAFTKDKSDGSHQVVSESKSGSFFGEVGVFTGEKRALGARTLEQSRIARVPEPTVKRIIEDSEPVRRILQSVIHHLKSTTNHYMDEVMRTEKFALVGTMVSSILHDFKNPFSIISLGSNIIKKRHQDDPRTVKICNNMETQIRRMVNMANDLAAFSRGEHEIEIAHVSLDTLFSHFHELNAPFFEDDRVELKFAGNGLSFRGDASRLLRVLQNLVGNAIDAIHAAEIEGEIKVIAEEDGDAIVIRVSDNGPGIPKDIRENFFEPFVTQGKNEGTGLGSAIVKSIVQAHKGGIEFETSARGTTFIIRLPKRQD
jgi:signal transduction histidine kinase